MYVHQANLSSTGLALVTMEHPRDRLSTTGAEQWFADFDRYFLASLAAGDLDGWHDSDSPY
jgi:hypothetical protein